jgi:hypothetical protein
VAAEAEGCAGDRQRMVCAHPSHLINLSTDEFPRSFTHSQVHVSGEIGDFRHDADFRQSDRKKCLSQINTDPMKSQMGYLDVVGEFGRSHSPNESLSQSALMCNKRSTTHNENLLPTHTHKHTSASSSIHFNFLSLPVYCLVHFTAPPPKQQEQ